MQTNNGFPQFGAMSSAIASTGDYSNFYQAQEYDYSDASGGGFQLLQKLMETRFNELGKKMDAIFYQQRETDVKIVQMQKSMQDLTTRQKKSEEKVNETQDTVKQLQKDNEQLASKVEWLQKETTLQKIRIFNYPGLEELKTEDALKMNFLEFVKTKLRLNMEIQEINKISVAGKGTKRHIIVHFLFWPSKLNVMRHLRNLKITDPNCPVSFTDDLTHAELQMKRVNLPLLSILKARAGPDQKVTMRRGTIFINGQKQTSQNLQNLGANLTNQEQTMDLQQGGATGFTNPTQQQTTTLPKK